VKVGIVLPQGLQGEYRGWAPERAWNRTLELARRAEHLGFESVWLYDHVQTFGSARDEPSFEAMAMLGALAAETGRIRLGPLVACVGYRNPALLAKVASTLDVISGGRFELGIGAGLKSDEALSYGFGFPAIADRMTLLRDSLEILVRMLEPGHATYEGEQVRVGDAINDPKGLQSPRIPIIVGGNGPNATWRIAARYADELNVDGLSPHAVGDGLPVIRARCEEAGRDPATLAVSVHLGPGDVAVAGPGRVARLAAYRELGIRRVMASLPTSVADDAVLESFAADAAAGGAILEF